MLFSYTDLLLIVIVVINLFLMLEIVRLRKVRHEDRDFMTQLQGEITIVRMDNQQLAELRARTEQLKVVLQQTNNDLWTVRADNDRLRREAEKGEKEKDLLHRGGYENGRIRVDPEAL